MKIIAALSLAAMIAAGTATSANAFGLPTAGLLAAEGSALESTALESEAAYGSTHIDHCHGRTSGTAHRLCGSATGGPSGGLF